MKFEEVDWRSLKKLIMTGTFGQQRRNRRAFFTNAVQRDGNILQTIFASVNNHSLKGKIISISGKGVKRGVGGEEQHLTNNIKLDMWQMAMTDTCHVFPLTDVIFHG